MSEEDFDLIVIGGGPAGMMAAIAAARRGRKTILLEKNEKLGKKLFITGKGRCNLTNRADQETLMANVPRNPAFLYSAFYTLGSEETMSFFEDLGVPLKEERGRRVFPASDKSSDVVRALTRGLERAGVTVRLGAAVTELLLRDDAVTGVRTRTGTVNAPAVVVATGGLSYPVTGSTGDGYRFAEAAGHRVTETKPSLCPLVCREAWVAQLEGLSLKNVAVRLRDGSKSLYEGFGEMLFTQNGVSGPLILSASSLAAEVLPKTLMLEIDLKPALPPETLDARIQRDFGEYKNRDVDNALHSLLPQKLIPVVVALWGVPGDKKVHSVTREERKRLISLLKAFPLTVTEAGGYSEAVITRGGVSVRDVNPSNMESKKAAGLYFAGEVLDVDGLTGGFNLQIAFSTGYLAGLNA